MFQIKSKSSKKFLDTLLKEKLVITGKDVVQQIKEKEERQKEFEESVIEELRNRGRG